MVLALLVPVSTDSPALAVSALPELLPEPDLQAFPDELLPLLSEFLLPLDLPPFPPYKLLLVLLSHILFTSNTFVEFIPHVVAGEVGKHL